MGKNKLKPTQIISQKNLKPSSLAKIENPVVAHKEHGIEQNLNFKNSENKILKDRDYGDLEI